MVKVAFGFKFQGIEKNELFSQGNEDYQNLRYKSLIIVNPKYIKISNLVVLNIK